MDCPPSWHMFTSTTPAHGRRSEKHKEVAKGSGFFVFEGLEFRGLGLRALGFRVFICFRV